MNIFTIKCHDTLPAIVTTLNEQSAALDLTGCSVSLFLAGILGTDETFEFAAEVTDVDTGAVQYQWEPGDTDLPGVYQAEWQVTYDSGDLLTVPNAGYDAVWIRDDLGPAGS